MRTILVGVDGSAASLDALSWARGLAEAEDAATVVVVSVLEPGAGDRDVPSDNGGEELGDQRARVRSLCSVGGAADSEQVVFVEGAAGPALLHAALCQEADLVVVGTRGRGGHLGPRLGDDAAFLAHHIEVPLLVVPAGRRWHRPSEVVVGVDGSAGSLTAVGCVVGMRGCAGAEVTAVYVCGPLSDRPAEAIPKGWHTVAVHDLACWTANIVPGDLRQIVRDEGHPSLTILAAAEEADADLVVAGCQGTNKITHTWAGSTAFQLLQSAARPTLLVPPPLTVSP